MLEVSPAALDVPNIESYVGLMHTLFALEDLYGLKIGNLDGEVCLRLEKTKGTNYLSMFEMFFRGRGKLQNSKMAKSQKKNITNGDIPILKWRSSVPKQSLTK